MASSTPARFVHDGSVTLAWPFQDEQDPYADAIVARFPDVEMLVPRLWHLEIANVLIVNERRGRCSAGDSVQWIAYLKALPITVDPETERMAWSVTMDLARTHPLTEYDAAYLELAIRESLPLATLDKQLVSAAGKVGVSLFQP